MESYLPASQNYQVYHKPHEPTFTTLHICKGADQKDRQLLPQVPEHAGEA